MTTCKLHGTTYTKKVAPGIYQWIKKDQWSKKGRVLATFATLAPVGIKIEYDDMKGKLVFKEEKEEVG